MPLKGIFIICLFIFIYVFLIAKCNQEKRCKTSRWALNCIDMVLQAATVLQTFHNYHCLKIACSQLHVYNGKSYKGSIDNKLKIKNITLL